MTSLHVDESLVPLPIKRRKVDDGDEKKPGLVKLKYRPNQFALERTVEGITPCTTLDVESLIEALLEVRDACGPLRLNVGDNTVAKFSLAREIFRGIARDAFDLAIEGMVLNDENNFNNNMPRLLLLQAVSENAYSMQRTYLNRVKKPFEMDLPVFQHRLRHIRKLMTLLPRRAGDPDMTDYDFKQIFINSMPEKYRAEYNYKHEHEPLATTTFAQITERFGSIKRHIDVIEKIDNKKDKKNDGSNAIITIIIIITTIVSGGRGRGNGRGSGRGGRGRGSGSSDTPRNPCRFPGHQNHDWKDCKANRNSANYDPNFVPRTSETTNSNNNNNNSGSSSRGGRSGGRSGGRGSGTGTGQNYVADAATVSTGNTTLPSQNSGNSKTAIITINITKHTGLDSHRMVITTTTVITITISIITDQIVQPGQGASRTQQAMLVEQTALETKSPY